jgi:hypothetical protein
MNMYHAAIAALLFRSTFCDLIHKIPANAIWPTPCRHQPLPSVHTLIKLGKGRHIVASNIIRIEQLFDVHPKP